MLPPWLSSVKRRIRRASRQFTKVINNFTEDKGHTDPLHFFLVEALEARGISYEYMRGDQLRLESDPQRRYLAFSVNGFAYYYSSGGALLMPNTNASVGPAFEWAISPLLSQKDLTNSILRRHGFSVPEGASVHRNRPSEACDYFSALLPTAPKGVCVKPVKAGKGKGVHVGVRDLPAFRSAFKAVAKDFENILIEETVGGTVYRFFSIAGRVIAIRYGVPAHVEGDGVHSIAELVKIKNLERAKAIRLTRPGQMILEEREMRMDSIPQSGEIIWLGRTSNLKQGADSVDATDTMHASYTALVEQAVQRFPGLILCGADVAIEDASVPATKVNYHFLELNDTPGFKAHHHPSEGISRDAAGAIVDYLMTRG